MTSKSKTTITIIARSAMALIVITGLGMALALQRNTLIDWKYPAAICLGPAIILTGLFARAGWLRKPLEMLLAAVITYSAAIGGFYTLNFYITDPASHHELHATVTAKNREERYRTRRLSRNRITRGEKYTVYTATLRLPDGREKRMEIRPQEYITMRVGRRITLQTETGLFGVSIIQLPHPIRRYTHE